jgi:hypothetical protein
MSEDEIRGLLREMRDEPVPPDSLARVRIAVAERTQTRSWTWALPWRIAAAVLAAACLLLVAILWRTSVPAPPAPPVVTRAVDPLVGTPTPQPAAPRRAAQRVRRVPKPSAPAEAMVIRIETPDPDVVILLIGDGAGL